jgi:hypothetical protein
MDEKNGIEKGETGIKEKASHDEAFCRGGHPDSYREN